MDDLISRQAAIDAVIKRDANCGIDSAEVLKSLPSAQPEREEGKGIQTRIGKWIQTRTGKWIQTRIGTQCSICCYKCQTTGTPQFCPYCGAEMSEEKSQ